MDKQTAITTQQDPAQLARLKDIMKQAGQAANETAHIQRLQDKHAVSEVTHQTIVFLRLTNQVLPI